MRLLKYYDVGSLIGIVPIRINYMCDSSHKTLLMFLMFFTGRLYCSKSTSPGRWSCDCVERLGEIVREEHADFCVQEDSVDGSDATRSILLQFTLRGSLFGRKWVRCTRSRKLSSFYWFTVTARICMYSLFMMQLIWPRKNQRHCRQWDNADNELLQTALFLTFPGVTAEVSASLYVSHRRAVNDIISGWWLSSHFGRL